MIHSIRHTAESLPEWKGKISRIEAEQILKGKAPGAYILRKDPEGLDDEIEKASYHADFVLILSIAEKGRIAEHYLFHTPKGWVVFSDEPRLDSCPAYESLPGLIHAVVSTRRHHVA